MITLNIEDILHNNIHHELFCMQTSFSSAANFALLLPANCTHIQIWAKIAALHSKECLQPEQSQGEKKTYLMTNWIEIDSK